MDLVSLGKSRNDIRLPPEMIRLFSGRGAVSIRDHSVTGIQSLQFTPFEQPRWRFELSFQETSTGCMIEDSTDDIWEHHLRIGEGHHPLGLNFGDRFDPADDSANRPTWTLVLQTCDWTPNQVVRKGTFHKRVNGKQISFEIESVVRVDERRDCILVQVTLTNRMDAELTLLARPRQRVGVQLLEGSGPVKTVPVWQWPGGRTNGATEFVSVVTADQPANDDGWILEVPAGQALVSHFAVELGAAKETLEVQDEAELAIAFGNARADTVERLESHFAEMPSITSPVPGLEEFYDRSLLSILDSRWVRNDWPLTPFYAAGSWLFTLAWDTSFASAAIALFDPDGLRAANLAYLEAGLLQHSYIGWDGGLGHHYAYTAFAGLRTLRDYLEITGDLEFLDTTLKSGESVLQTVEAVVNTMTHKYISSDGLADFGSNANDYLETRTDGYQSSVAIASLMLIDSLEWLLSLSPNSAAAGTWREVSASLRQTVNSLLWSEGDKWYFNRMPDGSSELVMSYQLYDALLSPALDDGQRTALLSHLVEGEFLGPFGMYSVAKSDTIHWDLDDADWGGGGQYLGQTLRIVEYLWRLGEAELAWGILERCLPWSTAFPYFPQVLTPTENRARNAN